MIQLLMDYNIDIHKHINKLSMVAVHWNIIDLLIFCMENGADPNYQNGLLLSLCLEKRNLDIAKYLLENGTRINLNLAEIKNSMKICNIDDAIAEYYILFRYLVDNGFDISDKLSELLLYGCMYDHVELTKYFIETGTDIHFENDLSLFIAAYTGHVQILNLLLESGADIHANNSSILNFIAGDTDPTCELIHSKMYEYVGNYRYNFDSSTRCIWTNINNSFKILMKYGAIISNSYILILIGRCIFVDNAPTTCPYIYDLWPIFQNTIDQTDDILIQNIIETGMDLNIEYTYHIYHDEEKTEYTRTILETYIMFCTNNTIIKLLLTNSADYSSNNYRALQLAIGKGNAEIVRILLELGSVLDNEFELEAEQEMISLIESFGIVNHSLKIKKLTV